MNDFISTQIPISTDDNNNLMGFICPKCNGEHGLESVKTGDCSNPRCDVVHVLLLCDGEIVAQMDGKEFPNMLKAWMKGMGVTKL
jgi:hypothetical protein